MSSKQAFAASDILCLSSLQHTGTSLARGSEILRTRKSILKYT